MQIKKLMNISRIIMGQSPNSSSYNELKNGIPFFQGKSDFGEINPKIRMYCTEPIKLAEVNDILMSVRAPVGDLNITDIQCCIGRGLCAIRGNYKIDNKYLYYFLNSKKKELRSKSTGSTFKAVNKSILENLDVVVFPLEIQHQIVYVLDKSQELINKRKVQIKALDELVKSKFIEMFGSPFKNNLGWNEKKFGELSKVRQGLQIPISKRKNEEVPNSFKYITIQYLNGGKEAEYIENPKENVICKRQDILMTRTGNTGMVVSDVEGVFHNNFFLIDFDRKILNKVFLVYYLNDRYVQTDIIRRASTSTIPDLNHGEFYKVKVFLPPIELQNKFENFTIKADKLKFKMENNLKELEDNFNALMQKAFKGELFN